MKDTFKNLIQYLKNPVLEKDPYLSLTYRFEVFFKILIISLLTGIIIAPIYSFLEYYQIIDMQSHKVEALFKDMSKLQILLIGAIAVPIIEELIFRAPIKSFSNPKSFKIGFYVFALLFGFMHITNFEINTTIILLSPVLVLPQILLGGYFGYIRVRLGLQWSMLLHSMYNGILFSIGFLIE